MKRLDALNFWRAKALTGRTQWERDLASRNANILRGKFSEALLQSRPEPVQDPEPPAPTLPAWLWVLLAVAALTLLVYRPTGPDPYRVIPESEVVSK